LDLNELEHNLKIQEREITNEEATKHGLVIPMLMLFGYNPYNVFEVLPEYTVEDVGRVDYVLMENSQINMVIEVKKLGVSLINHINQLKGYFDKLNGSNIGLLTDGNYYLFFSKDEKTGFMKSKPFLVISIRNNFRWLRESVWTEFIRVTRLNKEYIEDNLLNSKWVDDYNNVIKQLKGIKITSLERDSIERLLDIKI
jgi:hypothetical protein